MINLLDLQFIFGHFVATQGHSWPPKSKLSQTNHVTTQKDRKRGRIPMEIVSEVTLKPLMTLRPFQALFYNFGVILGSFGAILGPKMT